MDELEKIIQDLTGNLLYKNIPWEEAKEDAKAALLSWRDKHTAKMVREARLKDHSFMADALMDRRISSDDALREWEAQLTTNNKEE